jgi:hypothetical protein
LKIEVSADLFSSGRQDPNVERVVTQLSMDPSVSAVRWEILGQTTETQSTLLEEFAETRGPGPL